MSRLTRSEALRTACVALGLLLFAVGAVRVYGLEKSEIDYGSPMRSLAEALREPAATRISAQLGSAQLSADQRATFELCASQPLDMAVFENAFELGVLDLDRKQLLLRVPLDAAHLAHARRNSTGGCLLLGSGLLEHSGTYTIEAIVPESGPPPRAAAVPLRARLLAHTPLAARDRALLLSLGAVLLLLLCLQLKAASKTRADAQPAPHESAAPRSGLDPSTELAAAARRAARVPQVTLLSASGQEARRASPVPEATAKAEAADMPESRASVESAASSGCAMRSEDARVAESTAGPETARALASAASCDEARTSESTAGAEDARVADAGHRAESTTEPPARELATASRPQPIAAVVGSLLVFGGSLVPLTGPTLMMFKGLGMLALQVGLAVSLARGVPYAFRAQWLGLVRPAHLGSALVRGLLALPAVVGMAWLALRVVPSTGEAPIQTFVSWPSGMLAAALLGVVLPLGEELFFRGFLYGALLGYGRVWSAIANVVVFGSLHTLQDFGSWGGLLGVFAAGLVFLWLRIASGSVLIASLVHVAYNLTLSLASVAR
jgi:membrane protease YdiL (CAAX protease family)